MHNNELLEILQRIPAFHQIDPVYLEWMIGQGELTELSPGDYLFRKGDPVDRMHILVRGSVQLKVLQGRQLKDMQLIEQGDITGILPYSRTREAGGFGVAVTPTIIFSLHKAHFQEMEQRSHELVQSLVAVMTYPGP